MKPASHIFFCALLLLGCERREEGIRFEDYDYRYDQWREYLGGPDRNHYSILDNISKENILDLEVAWEFSVADSGQMQANPIVVDSVLYLVSAGLTIHALHAGTGKEIWRNRDTVNEWHNASRGVAFWSDSLESRIFFTRGSKLLAVDAQTGNGIPTFGSDGSVDLRLGLPDYAADRFVGSTTPGTVYKDLIVMPIRVGEGYGAAPGDIRAYDVRTGEIRWTFHTIPGRGQLGYQTWEPRNARESESVGGANNWAGMAIDPEAGIIYVPTGSAAPDFYGGQRRGDNLFANCLLALNANTGKRLWHYQMVHHDIWDRDPPAPPNLLWLERNGEKVPAVAQITKQGFVFVFHRYTGEPLFEIDEVPVPSSNLVGEQAARTQPIPRLPRPFARQIDELTEEDISPFAPDREALQQQFRGFIRQTYRPPDTNPALLLPGYDGGGEWGGAAADPEQGILYVNSNEMAWELRMAPTTILQEISPGASLYQRYCSSCHLPDRSGSEASGYPSLLNVEERLNRSAIRELILNGQGMMPGFAQLSIRESDLLIDFLLDIEKEVVEEESTVDPKLPYRHTGYSKWLDGNGLPAISPPWGQLHAIDLNDGSYIWTKPLGHAPSLAAKGINDTGIESYGGPAITAGGLIFIAGTKDGYFRVFDRETGDLLWDYELPAPAFMTPSIYACGGKQYVVVVCGGEKLGTPKGNKVLAFSL